MQCYNLDGFLIFINEDSIYWTRWAEYEVEGAEIFIDKFTGGVIIDKQNDIAILKPTLRTEKEFNYNNITDIKKYLKSLPNWDMTKYYIKLEYKGNSDIVDCKTLDIAEDDKVQELKKDLENL